MRLHRLSRKEVLTYLAASAIMGAILGIAAVTGTWHPRPWDETVPAVVFLLTASSWLPAWFLVERDRLFWASVPVCDRCGRKMVPAEVRVSWRRRLHYFRCTCVEEEL